MVLRQIAQIIWGGRELYGLILWIGGGTVSNVMSFLYFPFAQQLPILGKILYGIVLFIAILFITVLIFRVLQARFKSQTDSDLHQSVSESQVQGAVLQAGGDINIGSLSKPQPEQPGIASQETLGQIRFIEALIHDGIELCGRLQSGIIDDHARDLLKQWYNRVAEYLQQQKMISPHTQWYQKVYINFRNSDSGDIMRAIEAGLDILQKLLEKLTG